MFYLDGEEDSFTAVTKATVAPSDSTQAPANPINGAKATSSTSSMQEKRKSQPDGTVSYTVNTRPVLLCVFFLLLSFIHGENKDKC